MEEVQKNNFFKKLLNVFLDSATEAALITENDKILFVSHRFTEITGYSEDEVLKMSPLDFVHPDFKGVTKKNMMARSEVPYEIWAKRKDNSQFPVLLIPKMVEFDGKHIRIIAIRDLTKEKQHLQQELLLTKTFEQSHESIIITDPEATIIYVNQKFCDLTGYTKEEVIGQNPRILQSGIHSKKFYKSMWETLTSGKEWQGEFQNKKKDGTIYWEKVTITPIQNKNGKIQSYLGIKEDITTEKQIEENFKDTEIKYKALIDNAPLAIVTINAKGNIVMINQMMVDFLGSPSKEETMKINVLDFPLLKEAGVSAQFQKCIDTGEKMKFESDYISKWSKRMFYRLYLSPLKSSRGRVIGVLAIAEDISKEKRYEKGIIEAKEKAEETDRLKDIFLANMSHELRTPLNAIIGFSEFLKNADNLTPEQKEYVDYIDDSGTHLLKLINDLVDVSRIESKQLSFTLEKNKISDLMDPLIPVLRNQLTTFQKEHLEFIVKPYEEIKDVILNVDKSRFVQIITNLVNNAIKYTEKGEINLSCSVANNELIISVKDSGIGIPKNKQNIIFERFRQVEEKLSRKYEGSGLGLTLVKELTQLMKGKVWVESKLGKGSIFYVSFPIVPETSEVKKPQEETEDKASNDSKFKDDKFTVLLVEDNLQNRILIRNILADYNFNVLEANNGEEAIKLFNEAPYINAILMDLQMPVMDGIEATKIIRKTNRTIPIIAQTALTSPQDKEKALTAGCNDILQKPFKKDQLLLKIIDNLKVS